MPEHFAQWDWTRYYEARRSRPLHPLHDLLAPLLLPGRRALDLGCGEGHTVQFLLDHAQNVVGVDENAAAVEVARRTLPIGPSCELLAMPMQRYQGARFDVITAFFSIFFMPKAEFLRFWPRVMTWLNPGGVFAGQLMGERDTWALEGAAGISSDEAQNLLAGLELLHFEEAERDGVTILDESKHWHVFHVIARRPKRDRA